MKFPTGQAEKKSSLKGGKKSGELATAAPQDPAQPLSPAQPSPSAEEEVYNPVQCALCETEVGLREMGPKGAYHLFNVLATNS
jgi:hypothetical protein